MKFEREILDRNTTVYFIHENKFLKGWIIEASIGIDYSSFNYVLYKIHPIGKAAIDRLWRKETEIFKTKEELVNELIK